MSRFVGDGSGLTNLPSTFPTGGIIMWSGSIASIPSGWALCNGANGTPNLRNRFVVGAGDSYTVGATGGANTVALTVQQLPAHKHSASTGSAGRHNHTGSAASAGSHTHTHTTWWGATTNSNPGRLSSYWTQFNQSSNYSGINAAGAHSHSLSINYSGAHSHTVSVGNTGSGQAHENRPPYYALAYIMKL